ncbi:MAG: 50S ribosomal protein L11 methyltransferase [Roseitalea sp.]|jgi:ribosomal protein L11 methyltransferase|nr:50S ribosomal protein L11 methyltransferase [Roseitalea sp.]MBO6722551.1 50S ribosomal protein L11 methyltransferase [Roseitalea sp.]MBO6742325.1 50S ribosomal protein L11 methyltransferase [Roseitalea sp.]
MAQTRLFLTAGKADAELMFAAIETAFEDEGWPVAIAETSEGSGVFEVSIYVESGQADAARTAMAGALNVDAATLDVSTEDLGDVDWVQKSLEGLTAVEAGRFVVHGSHQRDAVRAGTIGIEIEAGQAFGTGHHGTTSGCLIMLDRLIARRKPAISLDLGAGSAVLAIAIARLARTPVLATDIDPVATRVAAENARLNGVHDLVRCETATGFGHRAFAETGPFDLIVANILARPLMAMAPRIARHQAPGGDVILSGILFEQRWKVLAAFRQAGLYHRRTIEREGWVTLHLR